MIFIPLHLAVLAMLMYLYAKHEADISVAKICMVFVPTIWILNIASNFIGPVILVLYFLLPFLFLKQWFYVGTGKAAAIAGTFTAYMIVFSVAFYYLMVKPTAPLEDETLAEAEVVELVYQPAEMETFITERGNYRLNDSQVLIIEDSPPTANQYQLRNSNSGVNHSDGLLVHDTNWFFYIENESTLWLYSGSKKRNRNGKMSDRLGDLSRIQIQGENLSINSATLYLKITKYTPAAAIKKVEELSKQMPAPVRDKIEKEKTRVVDLNNK